MPPGNFQKLEACAKMPVSNITFAKQMYKTSGYATMVHAGDAIRIALRQLLQNRK